MYTTFNYVDNSIHPNRADYLMVLIRRYRNQGYDYWAALHLARVEQAKNWPMPGE